MHIQLLGLIGAVEEKRKCSSMEASRSLYSTGHTTSVQTYSPSIHKTKEANAPVSVTNLKFPFTAPVSTVRNAITTCKDNNMNTINSTINNTINTASTTYPSASPNKRAKTDHNLNAFKFRLASDGTVGNENCARTEFRKPKHFNFDMTDCDVSFDTKASIEDEEAIELEPTAHSICFNSRSCKDRTVTCFYQDEPHATMGRGYP